MRSFSGDKGKNSFNIVVVIDYMLVYFPLTLQTFSHALYFHKYSPPPLCLLSPYSSQHCWRKNEVSWIIFLPLFLALDYEGQLFNKYLCIVFSELGFMVDRVE